MRSVSYTHLNKEKLIVAYHEIGHALVAAKQTESAPVHKITIIPRTSGALGYTMPVDDGAHYLMTKEELANQDVYKRQAVGYIPKVISCRYNPGGVFKISNDIMDNPGDAKYGMTTEQIFEAFKILKEKGAEEFGIHAFLASNTVTNEYYPMLAKEMFEMAVKLQKETGAHVKFINLSGGVGIAYKPDQTPNDIREIGEGCLLYTSYGSSL